MGTKTKYSEAIVDKICGYISSGLNNKQACAAAGISETSLLKYRKQHPGFDEKISAAREIMRSKVLAKIKAAGANDWRAHEAFLRLAFSEYRFSNNQQVNVAVQTNMTAYDPERAEQIAARNKALEEQRARALAAAPASEPLQLTDKSDASEGAREIAEEAERKLSAPPTPPPTPERLKEHPPRNIVERAEWREAQRRQACRDEVDEILDF
jgi:hypothetical protein